MTRMCKSVTVACAAVTLLPLLFSGAALGMDHGFDPSKPLTQWMEGRQRPDTPGSCCGKGDGYEIGEYWPNKDGSWTAVVKDGSAREFPDGSTRAYIATGTQIIVPSEKVNQYDDDLDNPTDTSWIFMTVYAGEVGTIYCFIRHPQGG